MFRNDYSEFCAKEILTALANAVSEQNIGYGLDRHSEAAEQKILATFGLSAEKAAVHFLAGGTQTNETVISYFLRPYEAVIACASGHINVHETGAVEATGHKVLTAPPVSGKLTAEAVLDILSHHTDEHMVKPRMVYVSDTTETGTVYTKAELTALSQVCRENDLLLFLDGARLGTALTAEENDLAPADLAELCDVFYVGGTKNGALFGEAVVFPDKTVAPDFRYHIKNRGAMLAKGFVPGLIFETLFTDRLYFKLAENANRTAKKIRDGLASLGVEFASESKTNQIFIVVDNGIREKLMDDYGLELWEGGEGTSVLRIVTSFATRDEDVDEFLSSFRALL